MDAPRIAAVIPRREQRFAVPEVRPLPQTGLAGIAIGVAAVFAMLVDGTAANIINTGLPYLQSISAATPDEASWIITAFNAAYYSTILFSPWLYARFSRKPLLIAGLLGFSVTSLLLIVTQPLGSVVLLRFLQGISLGCVFVPAGVLLFTSLPLKWMPYAPPLFALVVLGAGTMGAFIGGFLSETYGGAAVYVPGAIATLLGAILVYFAAPSPDKPQPDLRPDVVGFVLSLLTFGALQYLANEGERRNWFDDSSVTIAVWVLVVGLVAFAVWELYLTDAPLINLRLLAQKRNLAVGSVVNLILGIVGYSVITFIVYLETVAATTATLAGAMILLRFVTYVIGIVTAFALVRSRILGLRAVIAISANGSALAFWGFALNMTTTADAGSFIVISLVFGFFFSMLSQPIPAVVLGTLGVTDLAAGLSLYKVSAPVGVSIGTGIFQTLLDHRATDHIANLAAFVTQAHIPVTQYLGDGGKLPALAFLVSGQAQALAFEDVMRVFGLCVLLTIPIAFLADTRPGPTQ